MDLLEERCMRELDKDFQDHLDKHYGSRRKINLETIPLKDVPLGGLFIVEVNGYYTLLRRVVWHRFDGTNECDVLYSSLGLYLPLPVILDIQEVAYTGIVLKGRCAYEDQRS